MLTVIRLNLMMPCFACVSVLCFSGCLGPKKINKWVAQNYVDATPTKKKSDIITITSSVNGMGDALSETEKKTSNVLPLLFYWQYDYKNTCRLNPQIAINNFTATVLSYSNKALKQKLNGRKLELNIRKIPTSFAIDDKGHIVWVIVYAFSWEVLTVQPEDNQMEISYKILNQDNSEYKSGIVDISNTDKGIRLGMFQSLKKKTFQYLDQYDAAITSMSKMVADKISAEL
ncbi:hypothetical protein [Parafilimonas sp.]|uniref:hypothetical protein n=1 Tax=Parafilimonas sp. TaxID=1969739 RepID=UPI0039E2D6E2